MREKSKIYLEELQKKMGTTFHNSRLFEIAFTHRSFLNEARSHSSDIEHNERLEFLGDAVLELAVTRYLYLNYKNQEGDLTNFRAALVNSQMLAKISKGLGMEDFLLLSRGEQNDRGKARTYILANAFEAFVGALYLDQGFEAVERFIARTLLPFLPDIIEKKSYRDAKSFFQEMAQEKKGITPRYELLKEWGPSHAMNFIVGCFLENRLVGKGSGTSKQEAMREAAHIALMREFPEDSFLR